MHKQDSTIGVGQGRLAMRLARMLCVYMALCGLGLAQAADAVTGWTLKDTAGRTHQLAQYRGQWLILNMWAPWCPPCLEEMPQLETFYDAYGKKQASVIGVAVRYESVASVQRMVDDMLISYPIVLGAEQKGRIPDAEVLPTTYIYAPDGRLVTIKRGPVTKQWLETQIKGGAKAPPQE